MCAWLRQTVGAGVVLATRAIDKAGKSIRVTFSYEGEAHKAEGIQDFLDHWSSVGLNADVEAAKFLNQRLGRDSVESTGKSPVRDLVLLVEQELLAADSNLAKSPKKLVTAIGKDSRVKKAVKAHQDEIGAYLPQGSRGEISMARAADFGKELLLRDPDLFKELAAKLAAVDSE